MRWEEGRQGTGYQKLRLFELKLLKVDCYLLRYPTGSYLPPHRDPAPLGFEHWRLNVMLKEAERGGEGWVQNHPQLRRIFPYVWVFRSDLARHGVDPIKEGTRYVLSLGWLRKSRNGRPR